MIVRLQPSRIAVSPIPAWQRGASMIALAAALVHGPTLAQTASILRANAGLATPVVVAPATLPAVAPVAPNVAGMTSASARAIANQAAVTNAVNIATQANSAARAAAQALAQTVPNGLVAGGLVPVANPTSAALDPTGLNIWQGASAPVQSGTAAAPTVTITQTDPRALLSWNSFNVGRDTTLVFKQQATDVVVNRIVANIDPLTGRLLNTNALAPSQILGTIKADGTVVVINQNGIMFSATAQVNAHSFLASSLDIGAISKVETVPGSTLTRAVPTTAQDRSIAFLQNGLLSASTLLSAQQVQAGPVTRDAPELEGDVNVAAGANIASGSGGFVIIVAPKVVNAGQLSSPDGQVSLQSGRQVTVTSSSGASDSADPNVRGLLLAGNGTTPDSVTNAATGLITAPRGYISLGGTATGVVNDAGVLTSTTSVARNGKIALTGAQVTIAPDATIAITPDTGTDTIPQSAESVDAFKHSSIVIGGAPVLVTVNNGAQSTTTYSYAPSAAAITVGAGALIYAPSANVSIGASNDASVQTIAETGATPSSVLIDGGATIDVGGIKDFVVPASRNSIEITPVKRNELRDTPNYRDPTTDGSFTLNGTTVFVDPRLSGVRADGVAWVGSPLIEAGSYYAQIGVTAAELMTTGGNLTLGTRSFVQGSNAPAPSVTIKAGATIDVSGGWVSYQAGVVKTSRLLTADGRIVEIGKADPNDNFVGLVDPITASQPRFGFSQTYANPAAEEFGYEPGYTEGRDAGSLTIKASTTTLGGVLYADAFAGTQQIANAKEGAAVSAINRDLRGLQSSPTQLPNGGLLKIAAIGSGTVGGGADIIVYSSAGATPTATASEILLSDAMLSGAGLSEVALQSSGKVTFAKGSNLILGGNGVLVVDAGRSILFDGTISIPSGTITAQTYDILGGSVFRSDDDQPLSVAVDAPTPHLFDITVNGLLSTRGRWTNDYLVSDGVYLGSAYTNGGSVSLTVAPRVLVDVGDGSQYSVDLSGSIYVNAGGGIDVSGGGYVRPNGALSLTGSGGSVSLINQTNYFAITRPGLRVGGNDNRLIGVDASGFITTPSATRQSGLAPRTLESRVVIAPGTISGQGFAGGGSFTLVTPDLNFGAHDGATGTALPLDFFSTSGFASFALTTFKSALLPNVFSNGIIGNSVVLDTEVATVGAGETLNLTQAFIPSLLTSDQIVAVSALASGGDVRGLLGSGVPVDAWDRRGIALTLGGLTELDVAAGGRVVSGGIDASGRVVDSDGAALTVSKLYNAGTIRLAGGSILQSQVLPTAYVTDQSPAIGVASFDQVFGPADANGRYDENAANALGITASNTPGAAILSNAELTTTAAGRLIYLTATLAQGEGIRLAPGSTTDLSGISIRNPRAGSIPNGGAQKASGRISNGGTLATSATFEGTPLLIPSPRFGVASSAVTVSGLTTPLDTLRAGLALNAGSGATIDLRGASDIYDQEVSLGVFAPAPVWSNGGRLTLGAGGAIGGSTILAQGGAAKAEGGVLTWLDPVLRQSNSDGQASNLVAADQIEASGFDTFVAQDRLTTLGDATLSLGRGFYLVARPYTGNSTALDGYNAYLATTGTLAINAPYIHLESPEQRVQPVLAQAAASGSITLSGQTIDIIGSVYAEQSVTSLVLNASGDVRLTGVEPAILILAPETVNSPVASSLTGQLIVNGDLTINAGQVYPTTGTGSLQQDINALHAGTAATAVPFLIASAGADATIHFTRSTTATPDTPYSAGGNLLVQAAHIAQDGVLRVPVGRLVLGSNTLMTIGRQAPLQTIPVTQSVSLGAGGITSVSADGLKIPYGTTTDLIEYFFAPTSDGRVFAPPAAELRLAGDKVDVLAGATVDATGGGDLYAYEFVAGVGGSHDLLSRFNSDAFSGNKGLQYADGRQVYAIVPSLDQATVAPIDPIYSADYSALYGPSDAGRRVYLEAAPGLAAGWYTLLPAQYALLPGGYRVVENVGSAPPALGQSAVLRDGSIIVGGHYGVAGTDFESSQRVTFTVESQATFEKFSNIQLTSATTAFGDLATRDGLTVPQLPADAARLVFTPLSELSIATKFLTTPGTKGRGAQVDISGTAFEIVSPGAAPSGNGAIRLTTTDFDNLNAASLLIGGVRTNNSDGTTTIAVTTSTISIANDATHPLSAPEIMLAVDGVDSAITLADGAAVVATGVLVDTRAGNYIINADGSTSETGIGGVVRVANGPERLLARPGALALANSLEPTSIAIGEAVVRGQSILLDSSRDLVITDNLLTDAKPLITVVAATAGASTSIALGGDDIFFTAAPSNFRGLTITPDLEAQIAVADRLTLTSKSVIGFSGGVHTFKDLVVDARGIRVYGQATSPILPAQPDTDIPVADPTAPITVTLNTSSFSFANSDRARGTCTADMSVIACGATGNTLIVNAGAIHLGSGPMATYGFDKTVHLNASQGVFVEGSGSIDIGVADLAIVAPFVGDRALVADPRGTKLQPVLNVFTTGKVSLAGTGTTAAAVAAAPGATLTFGDIDRPIAAFSVDGVDVRATAGVLAVHATGSITASGTAILETPGYAKSFGDAADQVLVSAPGGQLTLVSVTGDVDLGAGTKLSIGGGTGDAGSLLVSAAIGGVTLAGAIDATAPGGAASLTLNSGTRDFDLVGFLTGQGRQFGGDVAIRTGAGDLTIAAGQTLRAATVRLTADGGVVDIAGTINTSGVNGGAIGLYGVGGVTLESTALLDAHADGYAATDTRAATGGNVTLGTAGNGVLTIADGAVIDVAARRSGARLVAQLRKDPVTLTDRTTYNYAQSDTGGDVTLRAPVFGRDGAETINISYRGTIKGASDVSVEGYRVYDLKALAGVSDCSVAADVCINRAGQVLLDVNAVPVGHANLLSAIAPGTIPTFVRSFDISASNAGLGSLTADPNYHARPGIELDYAGDIVLNSNWNLAAGTVDVAAATAAGAIKASSQLGNGLNYVVPGQEANVFNNFTDFVYRTGGKANGEAGVLTIRAGGNLAIKGSITDGFFTFADQTDPDYLSFQLGGGNRQYRPEFDLSCGVGGSCTDLYTSFDPFTAPVGNAIITIAAIKLVRGPGIGDDSVLGAPVAPYNPLANTPGALGAQANGAGDPIGSATLLPALADGRAAASFSLRLVGGAAAPGSAELPVTADPSAVAPSSLASVTVSGEQSYQAKAIKTAQSYGGDLQLSSFDPIASLALDVAPGGFLQAYEANGVPLDPTLYTRLTFTGAPAASRSYLVAAAKAYFIANATPSDQYRFIGPVNNPTSLTGSIELITAFLQSISADFGAKVETGSRLGYAAPALKGEPAALANATIYTRSLVRTGTGFIDVAAAGNVDLTNGKAIFRNVNDRAASAGAISAAQVGGTAIYTAGHVVTPAEQTANALGGGALTIDPNYAVAPSAVSTKPNLQGVLGNDPVYATGGGNVTISAGRDVLARRDAWSEAYRVSLTGGARDYGNAGTDTQLWRVSTALVVQDAEVPATNLRINPQLFSTGVGALGGGNVRVTAGRDISELTAVSDTSITTASVFDPSVPSATVAPALISYGGGNVAVHAGGDLLGGQIDVASGVASISAGGSIASARQLRLAATSDSPFASLQPNVLRVRVDDATATIVAHQTIEIGGIASPDFNVVRSSITGVNALDGTGFYSAIAGVSATANGNVALDNQGKDLNPFSDRINVVLPGSLAIAALFGDIDLSAAPGASVNINLAPSPVGQLNLYAGGDLAPVTLTMEDGDPSLLPGPLSANIRNFGFPTVLPTTDDNARRLLHNQRTTHAGDSLPGRIFADGDINQVSLALPKQARIGAGGDIIDMVFFGQNVAATDVTRITAGRDIVASSRVLSVPRATGSANLPVLQGNNFVLGGPGALFLEAGRDLGPFLNSAVVKNDAGSSVAYAGGVVTVGNDYNPWLGSAGAKIYAQFGVGKGSDYDALRDYYVDPANVANLDGDLFVQVADANGNKLPDRTKPIYAPILIDWLASNTGVTYADSTSAYAAFVKLPALVQRQFLLDKVYFNELAAPSRPDGPSYLQYIRGYRAVELLFPATLGYTANDLSGKSNGGTTIATGNLDLRLATLETQRGGDITILGPGGRVLGGSVVSTASQPSRRGEDVTTQLNLFAGVRRGTNTSIAASRIYSIPTGLEGVLTLRGGAVRGFTDGDFLLNQSRLFTVDGGDVTLWSSNGDLNAGQGAKTTSSNPPVVIRFNPDGYGVLDQAGAVNGAGIAALTPATTSVLPSVTLIAPVGTVDAGDAGVRAAGNVFVAAAQIANADNFKVGGTAIGIGGTAAVDLGAAASANAASGAAAQAAAAVNPTSGRSGDDRSRISVEVLGFGGDPKDDPCNAAAAKRPANCPTTQP